MLKLFITVTVILTELCRSRVSVLGGCVIDDRAFSSPALVETNNHAGNCLCYGLLLSDSWVLCRADCVAKVYCCHENVVEFYRLKFGLANPQHIVEVNTTRILVNPHDRKSNNIALIQLPSKLVLNEFIAPVQVPVMIGDGLKNHSGLFLTNMQHWYSGNIFTRLLIGYTRVTNYLQWIHDVTLIQGRP